MSRRHGLCICNRGLLTQALQSLVGQVLAELPVVHGSQSTMLARCSAWLGRQRWAVAIGPSASARTQNVNGSVFSASVRAHNYDLESLHLANRHRPSLQFFQPPCEIPGHGVPSIGKRSMKRSKSSSVMPSRLPSRCTWSIIDPSGASLRRQVEPSRFSGLPTALTTTTNRSRGFPDRATWSSSRHSRRVIALIPGAPSLGRHIIGSASRLPSPAPTLLGDFRYPPIQ